jgi:dehydrogenase/reductase SDR family protein 7B
MSSPSTSGTPRRFDGKRIWVTGASSGIGEAVALAFAREGAHLVLSARRLPELERVCTATGFGKDRVAPLALDLGDLPSLSGATARALAIHGGLDIVVHNGGISQRSLVEDTSLDVDVRLMNVNYLGAVAITKSVLPHMLERRAGRFVVVTSLMGYLETPMRSAYAATKHALHGFFESLRYEVADRGVGVTVVCPGYVKTNVTLNAFTGDGSALGTMEPEQARAMSAERCASRLVDAVAREKDEVFIAGPELAGVVLRRYSPAVYRLAVDAFARRARTRLDPDASASRR